VNQAGRDQHFYYGDGVRGARRVQPGTPAVECPYPGLASFGREQTRWFFGRDQLTATLIARLDDQLRTGGVQVVVAPSGAGKSSLLHAGLLPQLSNGALPGSNRWPTLVFTPTAHPLTALAAQVASRRTAVEGGAPWSSRSRELRSSGRRGRGPIRGTVHPVHRRSAAAHVFRGACPAGQPPRTLSGWPWWVFGRTSTPPAPMTSTCAPRWRTTPW
jgi:hypothetical protein